jgi:hypothetical protein
MRIEPVQEITSTAIEIFHIEHSCYPAKDLILVCLRATANGG